MKIEWTSKALSDLVRLYEFLAPANKNSAARVVQMLVKSTKRLLDHPCIGEQLEEFKPRKVHRIVIDHYEVRYELKNSNIYLL
jgi:plasmid stabilization system protein ParE